MTREGEEHKPVDKTKAISFVKRLISLTVRILKSSGQDQSETKQAFDFLFTGDVPENIRAAVPAALEELLTETENVEVRNIFNSLRESL